MFEALSYIAEWLNSGSYDFFTDAFAFLIKKATLAYISFLQWVIPFSWGIAKTIIQDLNISSELNNYWSQIPSETRSILVYLRLPEVIQNVLTAGATKLVIRFIPGI